MRAGPASAVHPAAAVTVTSMSYRMGLTSELRTVQLNVVVAPGATVRSYDVSMSRTWIGSCAATGPARNVASRAPAEHLFEVSRVQTECGAEAAYVLSR